MTDLAPYAIPLAIAVLAIAAIITNRRLARLESKPMPLPTDIAAQIATLTADLDRAVVDKATLAATISDLTAKLAAADADKAAALAALTAEFKAALDPVVTEANALAPVTVEPPPAAPVAG